MEYFGRILLIYLAYELTLELLGVLTRPLRMLVRLVCFFHFLFAFIYSLCRSKTENAISVGNSWWMLNELNDMIGIYVVGSLKICVDEF